LAIELAAARTRLLDPAALLRRLATSLDALGTGTVDMPERQRTPRATVEWSVGLLDDAERSLLETMAVFVDGWTIEAAADVAGLDEDHALELTEALARHSLVHIDHTELGPRSRMLETIRGSGSGRGPRSPRCAAGTPITTGTWPSRPTGHCGALDTTNGSSGCRSRRPTWSPRCASTWPTTRRRCPTCSGSCGASGSCGTACARPAPGWNSSCPPPTRCISRRGPSWSGRRSRPPS